jgi:hypothetical protein
MQTMKVQVIKRSDFVEASSFQNKMSWHLQETSEGQGVK